MQRHIILSFIRETVIYSNYIHLVLPCLTQKITPWSDSVSSTECCQHSSEEGAKLLHLLTISSTTLLGSGKMATAKTSYLHPHWRCPHCLCHRLCQALEYTDRITHLFPQPRVLGQVLKASSSTAQLSNQAVVTSAVRSFAPGLCCFS